jgi:hypothetical protein
MRTRNMRRCDDNTKDEAIKAGTGLVQASLEHLDEAERSWDKFVAEYGYGSPTATVQLAVKR